MNAVSLVGSVSRRAGGLFESVRRLDQEVFSKPPVDWDGEEKHATRTEPIRVSVLGLNDDFSDEDRQAWAPLPLRSFTVLGPKRFGYAPGLLPSLRARVPDLVHVHGLWQYNSIAAWHWHHRSGLPYLVSPHGMLDAWALSHARGRKRLAWGLYESRHLRNARCIRALCRSEADSIRELGLTNLICVIPNGVDLADPKEDRGTHEASDLAKQRVLLYLGRIHPKKGLAALLQGWAAAGNTSGWMLAIAGWDQCGHEDELKRLANALGLGWGSRIDRCPRGATVIFPGPKHGREKRDWLHGCEAVVLPSLSEGLPMAVLEAWAHSKPVLLTPQCNLPQALAAGAGLGMEADPDSIAGVLRILFRANRSTLEGLGTRGRELVRTKFAWTKIAAELRAVYLWLCDRGPRPACVTEDPGH
jgi:glycosyltransferase involved in cell wall biosynthesis